MMVPPLAKLWFLSLQLISDHLVGELGGDYDSDTWIDWDESMSRAL